MVHRGTRAPLRAALAVLVLLAPPLLIADGMIVLPRRDPRVATPFPLSVRYHHVEVTIKDSVARTTVDQEFFNPTAARLEGTYIFPLPAGSVISDFSMEIDGKTVRAEILDATKARGIYEDIVRSMRDPALLEYIGNGAFKVRVFPIEPHAGKRVRLSYSEVAAQDGGLRAYTYPLNTEKFSSAPLEDLSLRVNLESSRGLSTIFSPTHEVEIRRRGETSAVVGFEEKGTKPSEDFTLYFGSGEKDVGVSIVAHRLPGEDGYFLLTAAPAYETSGNVQPKDVTFVVDTSGSMSGGKMDQAKRAVRYCLANLGATDRFEVIRFSTEAEALFGTLAEATRENVARAREYVGSFEPIGGTNSDEALALALRANESASERPKIVVFITDGKPTIGETDEDRLVRRVRDANRGRMRIFTFGIGSDLNTHFLDKLTEATRASRTYIGDNEDVERPVASFFEKVMSPVMVDLSIEYGSGLRVSRTYPRELPDLFKGSQLVVFGRYAGSGDSVTLTGTVDGRRVSIPYVAKFPNREDANAVIAPLWAAQRIGYLLDEIRLRGEEKELVDEVTQLARKFGVVTPYTSYLIMEDERRRVAANVLPAKSQTLNAIEGAGEVSARMKKDYDAMRMKAGAPSVQASREVEALKNAKSGAATKQGAARMAYKSKEGKTQNLATQSKNIQGRAVYQVGNAWVDSQVQAAGNVNVRRIQFASEEYFDLLKSEPQSAQFLALGQNVRFAVKGQVFEIFE